MEAEKLFKKGEPAKAEDGSLLLVNEDQAAYKVNEAVMVIWEMCNGISFSELVSTIVAGVEQDASTVRTSLEGLVTELRQVKLIEIRQPQTSA